jgi:hypothetical protein
LKAIECLYVLIIEGRLLKRRILLLGFVFNILVFELLLAILFIPIEVFLAVFLITIVLLF